MVGCVLETLSQNIFLSEIVSGITYKIRKIQKSFPDQPFALVIWKCSKFYKFPVNSGNFKSLKVILTAFRSQLMV